MELVPLDLTDPELTRELWAARLTPSRADARIELLEDELADGRRSEWQWQSEWEQIRALQAQWRQELERELSH